MAVANGAKNGNGKFTPAVRKAILRAISNGCTDTEACTIAGVTTETLRRWAKRTEPRYVAFIADIARAREERIECLLENIRSHAETDWRAGAWLLSKAKPQQFSDKHVLAHEGGVGVSFSEAPVIKLVPVDSGSRVTG